MNDRPSIEVIRLKPTAVRWQDAVVFVGHVTELPKGERERISAYEWFRRFCHRRGIKSVNGLYSVRKLERAVEG